MTDIIETFVDEARAVTIAEAVERLGVMLRGTGVERMGQCPVCGGKDRFSYNTSKNVWNCRGAAGGKDAIGMAAHLGGYDVKNRPEFLSACADVLGRDVPAEGDRENEADRAARIARVDKRRRDAEERSAKQEADQNAYREKSIDKARGTFLKAKPAGGTLVVDYLHQRTGFVMPAAVLSNLRFDPRHTYWHGVDERGQVGDFHCGPAMIAPFVTPERRITGCHETWIDMAAAPKCRPVLVDGESILATKKMQGVKRGSFIPLCGLLSSLRWMGGEGIETVLAMGAAEGFREDTFYFAAGDLGNLCGPADPDSSFKHPTQTKTDTAGRVRSVKIAGPMPRANITADDAICLPEHVEHLVLLCDGDSEKVMTSAAIARAINRFSRHGREIEDWWADPGTDFAEMIVDGMKRAAQ